MRVDRRVFYGVLLFLIAMPPLSAAQVRTEGGWGVAAGGGVALHGTCGDCEASRAGLALMLGLRRQTESAWGTQLTWNGMWLHSDLAGGLARYSLTLDLTRHLGRERRAYGRLGGGPALSTTVEVEGPPAPPAMGDVVVAIGDSMGLAIAGGLGLESRAAEWLSWGMEAGGVVQRVGAETIVTVSAMVRAVIE